MLDKLRESITYKPLLDLYASILEVYKDLRRKYE